MRGFALEPRATLTYAAMQHWWGTPSTGRTEVAPAGSFAWDRRDGKIIISAADA